MQLVHGWCRDNKVISVEDNIVQFMVETCLRGCLKVVVY